MKFLILVLLGIFLIATYGQEQSPSMEEELYTRRSSSRTSRSRTRTIKCYPTCTGGDCCLSGRCSTKEQCEALGEFVLIGFGGIFIIAMISTAFSWLKKKCTKDDSEGYYEKMKRERMEKDKEQSHRLSERNSKPEKVNMNSLFEEPEETEPI